MTTLFIDCSFNFQFGILDNSYQWHDYGCIETSKSASLFHQTINQLLLKNQLTLKNINQLIVGAGPGSYTGIKVVDGFKQMAKVFGIKTFSYWSFEIPALSGNTFGAWLSTAYKKEVFIDTWKDNQTENHLIAIEMLDSFISNFRGELFASNDELEKNITEKKYSIVQTDVLIKKNPQMIFTQVVKLNLQRDLAYFRSLDKEYKTTQPQFARN